MAKQQVAWRCTCGKESDISGFVQAFVDIAVEKELRAIGKWLDSQRIEGYKITYEIEQEDIELLKQGIRPAKPS